MTALLFADGGKPSDDKHDDSSDVAENLNLNK